MTCGVALGVPQRTHCGVVLVLLIGPCVCLWLDLEACVCVWACYVIYGVTEYTDHRDGPVRVGRGGFTRAAQRGRAGRRAGRAPPRARGRARAPYMLVK